VIAHAIGDADERRIVAGHVGVDEKRVEHLRQMKKGETIVYLEGTGVPKNVGIWPIDQLLEGQFPKVPITSEKIKRHMEPIFEKNQNLRSSVDLPTDIVGRITRVVSVGRISKPGSKTPVSMEQEHYVDGKILEFVKRPTFANSFMVLAESVKEGYLDPLIELVTVVAKELAAHDLDQQWVAERLVIHSGDLYPEFLSSQLANQALAELNDASNREGP
jgi:hypothetical protein